MSMNVNNMSQAGGGSDLGDPALGPHYARLVGFAYMGVQERKAYKGEAKPPCGKLLFTFELLDDFCEIDGVKKPRWISKVENAFNTTNANAVKIYGALDPTNQFQGAFDQLALNTVPCMVNIVQKVDANGTPLNGVKVGSIGTVAKDPSGNDLVLPAVQNPVILFDFDEPTLESYATLKPWMQKMVKEATNFQGSQAAAIAQQYDAQQAATSAAQPAPGAQPQAQTPPPAQPAASPAAMAPPPVATPAPATPPPVAAPAATPEAPPGFRYDQATNSYVPDVPDGQQSDPVAAGSGTPPPPPAGGNPY